MFLRSTLLILMIASFHISAFAQQQVGMQLTGEALQEYIEFQNGQGRGCFETMLEGTSEGMAASVQAQANETNALIGLSQKYFDREQSCGNQLSEIVNELSNAQAEHEERLMTLPAKIKLQQIEHQEQMNAIKDECRNTSGEVFNKWNALVSTGVVNDPTQLMGRTRAKNGYRKLFYEDCIASEGKLDQAELLSKKLSANVELLQASIDASAMKLSRLTQQLSFKQGVVAKNCMKAKELLDYQARLAKNQAGAVNSQTKTNNFLRMLSGANICLGGPANTLDITGAGVQQKTAN